MAALMAGSRRRPRNPVTMIEKMAATSSGEPAWPPGIPRSGPLSALFMSLRPAQWVKNLVLPLPFLFGGALGSGRGWALAVAGFLVFCAVTSAIYLVNDVMDRERDAAHPVKRHRPLARGDAPFRGRGGRRGPAFRSPRRGLPSPAAVCRVVRPLRRAHDRLLALAEARPVPGGPDRGGGAAAAGARGRGAGGAAPVALPDGMRLPARALPRRRQAPVGAPERRPPLVGRAPPGARGLPRRGARLPVRRLRADATVAYTAYSVIPSTLAMHGGRSFAPTIPFVVLGIARYVRLVYRRGGGGNPTQALLIDDPLLLLIVVGWVLTAGVIIYGR